MVYTATEEGMTSRIVSRNGWGPDKAPRPVPEKALSDEEMEETAFFIKLSLYNC